jgi:hypothetical protein
MKYFLKEAYTPPNPNISPVNKSVIYNVVDHIIYNVLPAIFGYIHAQRMKNSKYKTKKLCNDLLLKIVNENAENLRSHIENNANQVYLHHDMSYYLIPASINYMNSLINDKYVENKQNVYVEYSFQTNEFNLTEDKPAQKIRGEAEYIGYFPEQLKLIGHITININDAINLDLYDAYIKKGITHLFNAFLQDTILSRDIMTTVRHEAQHAYQIYNACFFNFYKFVKNKKAEGVILTPKEIDEIFHDEISIDATEGKHFTYFENAPMRKMAKLEDENLIVKDQEKKDYYYTNAEAPVRLNDFVIAFVDLCRQYLQDHEEILKLLFSLLDLGTGRLIFDVVEGDQHLLNDISQNIVEIFPFIPLSNAYKFAMKMAKEPDISYNFPFIEDILTHADLNFRQYFIKKLYSKVQKEFARPSL